MKTDELVSELNRMFDEHRIKLTCIDYVSDIPVEIKAKISEIKQVGFGETSAIGLTIKV